MEKKINTGITVILKCARHLLLALFLVATAPSILLAAVELKVGSGDFVFVDPQSNEEKPIIVFYYKPKNLTANSPVVFVMHGVKRNGREYRDTWIEYSRAKQFLLLVPEFSDKHCKGSREYNLGNMFTPSGEPIAESKWTYTAIEHIFDYVKTVTKMKSSTYSIYGNSAGGQFVQRLVLFKPNARISTAVCANPGWYTMPVHSDKFPYGLKGTGMTDESLQKVFQRKLIVLLGDKDIDENHIFLRKTSEAMAQGKHRFARGQNFYKTAKHEAARRGIPFKWELKIVRGVGHSNEKMAKAAAELVLRRQELVDPIRLDQAINSAADYLKRMCDDKGKFAYRVNLNPEFVPSPEYNILRHAGTMYALSMYEQRYPDEAARDTLARAARFLREETVAPVPGRDDLLAAWSYPEITGWDDPVKAKLGGTALGLVALLSIEKSMPTTTSIDYLRKMGRFLLFMQENDGSFHCHYVPTQGGKTALDTSLYYPSQAVLALLMLYEKDQSSVWLQAAADGIGYLARSRSEQRLKRIDHWALLASAKLWPLYDRCKQPPSRQEILQQAMKYCETILAAKPEHWKDSVEYGCLAGGGLTCSTATRLEGLLAALTFLPEENGVLRERIISTSTESISFLIRSQIRSGKYAGGIPWALRRFPSRDEIDTEVRIDYVQHALSAMIQYKELFYPNVGELGLDGR